MTVGFYSPLPPARTGVAEYAAALLPFLHKHVDVRVNRDGEVNLYHVGNNNLHTSIYQRALRIPGVVVLHDAVLHHFMLGYCSPGEYIEEFIYNYGNWSRTLANRLWQDRGQSAANPEYFRFALIKRLVESSRAVIVHNAAAAQIVRDHHPTANVIEIPHLLIPHEQPHRAESELLRRSLGSGMKFAVLGHLRESKRILSLLRVFSRHPEAVLLLAGEIASRDLRRACEPYLKFPNIHRLPGFLSSQQYWTAAHAVDACINLRYPAAGETSGVAIGMMGEGIPVVMTDSLENSSYPGNTCIKVSAGITEEPEIEAMLEWAHHRPARLRSVGAAAAEYVNDRHDGRKVAEAYARVLAIK